MMNKTDNLILIISVAVLLASTGALIAEESAITGKAIESPSSVVIQGYYAVSASDALTEGVNFTTVTSLPASNVNATNNYNSSNSDKTEYYITVSSASNVNVDFCVKANTDLRTSSGDVLGLDNMTWEDDTANSDSVPAPYGSSMTTAYVKGSTAVSPGSSNYYRFWLDIPAGQASGTYNNTLSFEGVQEGQNC